MRTENIILSNLGIGQYSSEYHWKGLSNAQKAHNIAKPIFKALFIAALVGGVAFVATASWPVVAIACATVALFGIAAVGFSLYRIHSTAQAQFEERSENQLGIFQKNNRIYVTKHGTDSREMKERLIREAQHSIDLSGSYCGGKWLDELLAGILKDKLKQGVQVRIISSNALLTASNREHITHLAALYPDRFCFLVTRPAWISLPTLATIENHTKLLVVDRKWCMTGGTGLHERLCGEYVPGNKVDLSLQSMVLGKGLSDMDVVVEGPIAETMGQQFERLLQKWVGLRSSLFGKHLLQIMTKDIDRTASSEVIFKDKQTTRDTSIAMVVGSYEHGRAHGCKQALLQAIHNAQTHIVLGSMSIHHPEIVQALIAATKRNVRVQVITNGLAHNSMMNILRGIGPINRIAMSILLRHEIEIYEFNQPSILYHKKLMVIDSQLTLVGSANLSTHCLNLEDEDLLLIDSTEVAQHASNLLQNDQNRSKQLLSSFYAGFRGCLRKTKHILLGWVAYQIANNIKL